jgi:toxin ParE1/3/4
MAEVVWVEPALHDLDEIADFIALDDAEAAHTLIGRVFEHVEKLAAFPKLGSRVPELPGSRYRQIVEPPCRVIYRLDGKRIVILHVLRGERLLQAARVASRDTQRRRTDT